MEIPECRVGRIDGYHSYHCRIKAAGAIGRGEPESSRQCEGTVRPRNGNDISMRGAITECGNSGHTIHRVGEPGGLPGGIEVHRYQVECGAAVSLNDACGGGEGGYGQSEKERQCPGFDE